MTNKLIFLFCFLMASGWSQEKNSAVTTADYLDIFRDHITGEKALETTGYVAQFWRVVGNEGFNKSILNVAAQLEAAGYVPEEKANSQDRFTYRLEKRPLQAPTWEPIHAQLSLVGESSPLLLFNTNRNMIYLRSTATPPSGITGDVITIPDLASLEKIPVKGKIIFTEAARTLEIYEEAVLRKGALGMLSYNNPSYLQPEKNTTSIQFRSLPHNPDNKWAIALSYEAKERLKKALEKGQTQAKITVQTKIYPSEDLTLVADIKGSELPEERLVFSAHVQEPGANDNASGVGAQLEMAMAAAKLIKAETLDAHRSLTFLWGDEIVSTERYITEDAERAKNIKWGISLDMVGENTDLTGGSFLIEKMPDPSAIWTRGTDKHSEWGGRTLRLEEMKPHYLNDFILNNFKAQGSFAQWEVNTNPYEGGSDHAPFLQANIPGLLLWHFTDQFYHTDNDTVDKVSQETLKNVSTAALASAFTLLNGDSYTATAIVEIIRDAATNRLANEYLISERALKEGAAKEDEIPILQAWTTWYLQAIESTRDMASSENMAILEKAILMAQSVIDLQAKSFIGELERK